MNPSGSSARPMKEILIKLAFKGRKANNGNGTYDSLSCIPMSMKPKICWYCVFNCRAAESYFPFATKRTAP
ncbi:hypothetical protein HMPREF3038_00644 [Akkermansia sp. KLE1797]|nr:hypothetical protein HMPREF3038_00644 [Akkermansia sp. KLE1797]KXU54273.1 hypothetical protein HMPREF3039_01602 [Akkermansia sp. KLE1798]KZA04626.1 hypothetical protein HMPREF1326_01681 [Akkermansia sp. KLE1605]